MACESHAALLWLKYGSWSPPCPFPPHSFSVQQIARDGEFGVSALQQGGVAWGFSRRGHTSWGPEPWQAPPVGQKPQALL